MFYVQKRITNLYCAFQLQQSYFFLDNKLNTGNLMNFVVFIIGQFLY